MSYELTVNSRYFLWHNSNKIIPNPSISGNRDIIDYFLTDLPYSGDFSPFGVELSGRTFDLSGPGDYRYAFQGQESDDEIKGEGNFYFFNRMV